MRKRRSSGSAAALAILMVGVGIALGWLTIAPGIFGHQSPAFDGNLPGASVGVEADTAALAEGVAIIANLQVSQPRDPFRPLITDTVQIGGEGSGQRTGIGVRLISVTGEGVLRATVEVNGVEYDVGVGDVFAGSFKVISLTPPDEDAEDGDPDALGSGVFLFGDNAFELEVGQQILK